MADIKRPKFRLNRLNPVIWFLTFNDVFTWGPRMAVISLVGIYVSEHLGMNAVEVVGIGTGLSYIARAVGAGAYWYFG